MPQGYCQRQRKFYGFITVTERGQIAIPVVLRRELKIKQGDKLVVIKRADGQGLNLIKPDILAQTFEKLAKN